MSFGDLAECRYNQFAIRSRQPNKKEIAQSWIDALCCQYGSAIKLIAVISNVILSLKSRRKKSTRSRYALKPFSLSRNFRQNLMSFLDNFACYYHIYSRANNKITAKIRNVLLMRPQIIRRQATRTDTTPRNSNLNKINVKNEGEKCRN